MQNAQLLNTRLQSIFYETATSKVECSITEHKIAINLLWDHNIKSNRQSPLHKTDILLSIKPIDLMGQIDKTSECQNFDKWDAAQLTQMWETIWCGFVALLERWYCSLLESRRNRCPTIDFCICKLCTSVWWLGLRYIYNRMQHHVLQDIALNKKKQMHSHTRFVAYKIQQGEWRIIKQIYKLGYICDEKQRFFIANTWFCKSFNSINLSWFHNLFSRALRRAHV
jgi:hypothetical protein